MIVSRIFSHILAHRIPVDDGVLQLITADIGPDDAITCIGLYDTYGVPPPKLLILRLSSSMTAECILDTFTSKIHTYVLQVHLSRPDVSMSISCMDRVLDQEDEYLWYIAL